MKATSPLDIYPYLPENSEELFDHTRMSLALQLINRTISLKSIKDKLVEIDPTEKSYKALEKLLAPAIIEVLIGVGENQVTIGGDDVLFRHNKTFYNKTPIAISISDLMSKEDMEKKVEEIVSFEKFYIGKTMKIEMISIFCESNDPDTFEKATKIVNETLEKSKRDLPLVLYSYNPKAIRKALEIVGCKKPLIYGANTENWREMAALALEFEVPVTVCGNGDLDLLQSLAVTFEFNGISDIVLDPGFENTKEGFKNTFQNYVSLRISGINGDTNINYPTVFFGKINNSKQTNKTEQIKQTNQTEQKNNLKQTNDSEKLFSEIPEFLLPDENDIKNSMFETVLSSVMTVRYADLLILNYSYPHEILPLIHLADTMYTDPRVPASVTPGLYEVGNPDDESPVLFTTNFALTFHTVESDLSSQNIDCYLIAVNTGGLGVEAAAAGGQLTAETVKKEFENANFDISKTKYKTIIIPGLAARIQGELEILLNVKVLVGPTDSGKLPLWLETNFNKK